MDYADNAERFIFFCKSVVHLARYLPWRPDLVHVHDWQAALVPVLMLDQKLREGWSTPPPTCLTIHNMAYQGNFPAAKFALTNLPPNYFQPDGLEYYGRLNCLKGGIRYADLLTTVSPRYAREITTELYGCGLDGALRDRQKSLFGILNGVDYDEWKTEGNAFLKNSFTAVDLRGKEADKAALQQQMGLPIAADIPLFGTVSRLADQKGIDLELTALQEMLAADMQVVFLGSGDREYERAWRKLAERFPAKCAVKIGFDTALSHRIEAGCDFYIMPSRFEPCGLNQMYSLRYGAVPIVRLTGGLDDSVTDITENPEKADGIKFAEYSVRALSKAIRKALVLYGDKDLLAHYRRNGMARDFSWERTAVEYASLYRKIPALA
jgi:starch synthase